MTKKFLLILLTFILNLSLAYSPYIPKGTLVQVLTKIPLTREHLEEGSIVYFIAPADVWVQETKAINKGDIFKGYVSNYKIAFFLTLCYNM